LSPRKLTAAGIPSDQEPNWQRASDAIRGLGVSEITPELARATLECEDRPIIDPVGFEDEAWTTLCSTRSAQDWAGT